MQRTDGTVFDYCSKSEKNVITFTKRDVKYKIFVLY